MIHLAKRDINILTYIAVYTIMNRPYEITIMDHFRYEKAEENSCKDLQYVNLIQVINCSKYTICSKGLQL